MGTPRDDSLDQKLLQVQAEYVIKVISDRLFGIDVPENGGRRLGRRELGGIDVSIVGPDVISKVNLNGLYAITEKIINQIENKEIAKQYQLDLEMYKQIHGPQVKEPRVHAPQVEETHVRKTRVRKKRTEKRQSRETLPEQQTEKMPEAKEEMKQVRYVVSEMCSTQSEYQKNISKLCLLFSNVQTGDKDFDNLLGKLMAPYKELNELNYQMRISGLSDADKVKSDDSVALKRIYQYMFLLNDESFWKNYNNASSVNESFIAFVNNPLYKEFIVQTIDQYNKNNEGRSDVYINNDLTTVEGLVMQPVQRICKYPLLFREISEGLSNNPEVAETINVDEFRENIASRMKKLNAVTKAEDVKLLQEKMLLLNPLVKECNQTLDKLISKHSDNKSFVKLVDETKEKLQSIKYEKKNATETEAVSSYIALQTALLNFKIEANQVANFNKGAKLFSTNPVNDSVSGINKVIQKSDFAKKLVADSKNENVIKDLNRQIETKIKADHQKIAKSEPRQIAKNTSSKTFKL